jgi:hypothetical protein
MTSVSTVKRMILVLILSAASVVLSACDEISVKNGEVPDQYIEAVGEYMGLYHGFMDGVPALLEVRYVGNKPEVSYRDFRGADILHPKCGSLIGKLETLKIGKKDQGSRVHQATFTFDAARCSKTVKGRKLKLEFSKSSGRTHLDVSVLKHEKWEQRCDSEVSGGSGTESASSFECRQEKVSEFIKGRFRR